MADEPAGYEWDYDDEPHKPKILWGRVVVLGIFMLLAFLLGRAVGGGGGEDDASKGRIVRLQADLEAAQERIETLEEQNQTDPSPESSPRETPETEEYTIKPGDNLATIAQEFYGDPSLDDCLAAANDIEDPASLRAGETIFIPPDCSD
ncbi:MAG: LysM peptidoglycan-binding domain-containing protein [Actinomycetota bacterium]